MYTCTCTCTCCTCASVASEGACGLAVHHLRSWRRCWRARAVCCDIAYAFTAQWSVRLVTSLVILASLIAAIAGYKRFRRKKDLWGPYASVQALEVGSYL